MPLPSKVEVRLAAGLKKFQPVLESAKSRDINEADTSLIVVDMLQELFGYQKYSEITSQHAVRGTFCDLALSIEGQLCMLLEVKAVGLDLKDAHVKQAVDYAANQGVDWVILTNGPKWRVYKVLFAKPIEQELVLEIDACVMNARVQEDLERLYLLTKEGWHKSHLSDYHTQKQALSRFSIAAVLLSEPVLDVVRRELRRAAPDIRISADDVRTVLEQEVLKREVLEGEKAASAKKHISRAQQKALRITKAEPEASASVQLLPEPLGQPPKETIS